MLSVVGAAGTAAGLVMIGYSAGLWRERRRGPIAQLHKQIELLRKVLSSIRLLDISATPQSVTRGSVLTLDYHVSSGSRDVTVWLGASLIGEDCEYWEVDDDACATLGIGKQLVSRHLRIADHLAPGVYKIAGQLWLGPKSQPAFSIRLDENRDESIIIK